MRLFQPSRTASQDIRGASRTLLELREASERRSKLRGSRFMREHGLRALHGCRTRGWTVGWPGTLILSDLQRPFVVTRKRKAWLVDITYFRT